MSVLKKLFFLLLLVGAYGPAIAAVEGVNLDLCGVYSDKDGADKKQGGKEEEEEPDCE